MARFVSEGEPAVVIVVFVQYAGASGGGSGEQCSRSCFMDLIVRTEAWMPAKARSSTSSVSSPLS